MKPTFWQPEEKDKQVNHYLDRINHAPYVTIFSMLLGLLCLFTIVVLLSSF